MKTSKYPKMTKSTCEVSHEDTKVPGTLEKMVSSTKEESGEENGRVPAPVVVLACPMKLQCRNPLNGRNTPQRRAAYGTLCDEIHVGGGAIDENTH